MVRKRCGVCIRAINKTAQMGPIEGICRSISSRCVSGLRPTDLVVQRPRCAQLLGSRSPRGDALASVASSSVGRVCKIFVFMRRLLVKNGICSEDRQMSGNQTLRHPMFDARYDSPTHSAQAAEPSQPKRRNRPTKRCVRTAAGSATPKPGRGPTGAHCVSVDVEEAVRRSRLASTRHCARRISSSGCRKSVAAESKPRRHCPTK